MEKMEREGFPSAADQNKEELTTLVNVSPSLPHLPELLHQKPSDDVTVVKVEAGVRSASLLSQMSPQTLLAQLSQMGPSDRCTPSQAQAMGQHLLAIIALHERNNLPLPSELQNSFDVFHRCLAVVYGTFFLNLYSKANAPCLLCHGCKSLYPPGQFIHHSCPVLPPNIVPCRSRMWRRCLVPLVSQGMDKLQQKQRWKYILEKFSVGGVRRNPIPPDAEAQILEMPECKRGRFVTQPGENHSATPGAEQSSQNSPPKSSGSSTPNGTQNLLDVDTVDYEGEDDQLCDITPTFPTSTLPTLSTLPTSTLPTLSTLPTSTLPSLSTLPTLSTHPTLSTLPSLSQQRPDAPPKPAQSSALGLAEQLVVEVRWLQQELSHSRAKLQVAENLLRKMPSEAGMREQLALALASQQAMKVERDQALEQTRLARERANRLQAQLDRLRAAHVEMEKHFGT